MTAVARMRDLDQGTIRLAYQVGRNNLIVATHDDVEFDSFVVIEKMTVEEATLMYAKQLAMYRVVVDIDDLPEAIRDNYVDYLRSLVTANRIVLAIELPPAKTAVDVTSLANGDS